MKTNQTDQLNHGKSGNKTNPKPPMADDKKESKRNVQFTKDAIPDKDVLGMDESDGEVPADKTPGNSQLQKTESKTGKNNLKKGGL